MNQKRLSEHVRRLKQGGKIMMKIFSKNILGLFIILLVGCSSNNSWISHFVKYEGNLYNETNEEIDKVGNKLGEVEFYLEKETDAQNFSSNFYSKGTEIYEIDGVNTSDAIAVKVDNKYIKLVINTD